MNRTLALLLVFASACGSAAENRPEPTHRWPFARPENGPALVEMPFALSPAL